MAKRGRPTKTESILRSMKNKPEQRTAIATDMYLPNHSGIASHPESKKNFVPYTGANANIDIGNYNLTTTGTINSSFFQGDVFTARANGLFALTDGTCGMRRITDTNKLLGKDGFIFATGEESDTVATMDVNGNTTFNGKVVTNEIVNRTGTDITLSGHLVPASNNALDLGSASNAMQSIYFDTNISDGTNNLTMLNLKTAYDHSQDNTQAHSDYLINNGNDATTGELTAAGFVTTTGLTINNATSQTALYTTQDNTHDIGSTSFHSFRNIYMKGSLTDDTNSVTVAQARTGYNHSQISGTDTVHPTATENQHWDNGYVHSINNSQAHSDYLLNNDDDTTTGELTAAGLVTTTNISIPTTTSSVGLIKQNGVTIFHTYVPTQQSPTYSNTFIGEGAGSFILDNTANAYRGTGNVAIGEAALGKATTGFYNFAMGTNALRDLTTGYNNVAIGHQAGANIEGGEDNFYFGRDTGVLTTSGGRNLAIGTNALRQNVSSDKNVAMGYQAGYYVTGGSNILLGSYAGKYHTTEGNRLIVDSQVRSNKADEISDALIYGVMAADPLNQQIKFNAGVASGTKTFSTEGPTDNVDVTGINTLFVDTSSNNVTIGGFVGGATGQRLAIVKVASANTLTLENNEGTGNQDIRTHDDADEVLGGGKYGGFDLVFNGTYWHDINHKA